MGLLLFWNGTDGAAPPTVTTTSAGGDDAPRGKRKRYRNGDEGLSEAELQFMHRKIAELKSAKTKREKEAAASALETSLDVAAENPESADEIRAAVAEQPSAKIPQLTDYSRLSRDASAMEAVVRRLTLISARAAIEAKRKRQDEEDIELISSII
jgi:hypothetical protein